MGFMTGPAHFIREARVLRRLMSRHPPANNQFIVAQFLKRGYHDALIRRLSHSLSDRWHTLRESLAQHLPEWEVSPSTGGSSFWLRSPRVFDTTELQRRCAARDILFEAGDVFFSRQPAPETCIRLGFSSIPVDRINTGIRALAEVIAESSEKH